MGNSQKKTDSMILKNKNGHTVKTPSNGFFIKFVFIKYAFFLLIAVLIAGGAVELSRNVQMKGYNGLFDFISTISSNYWNGKDAHPENISIEIKVKDINKLEKNRAQALERGVIINDIDGDYVSATLEYQQKKIKIKLRLKGHMTDHLQDNKWSFRIKVQDKDSFIGMKRFSIQHPGTRGYIYEWIYHELMKREGIIALRYKFMNVTVNGKDWGIYAIEENFDKELIAHNNRKNGPILRFNPDLYWVNRYNEMKHFQPLAEYASYYSSNPEAYREEDVLKDSIQRNYYLKALALLEGFRCKRLTAAQVFDIPRMARFHAIIDLVGGQHSIDWSDLKYYYNPVTGQLEPVAYESFTTFPFESIAGNYKYTVLDSGQNYKDLHTALFSDPAFFRTYIKELERIADPTYLDTFFKDAKAGLKDNLAILYKEFPYKKFEPANYYANQLMIKKILDAPKSFHAYLKDLSAEHVCLELGSIESLPIEIKSVKINNYELYPAEPIILPAKQYNTYTTYKEYYFQVPAPGFSFFKMPPTFNGVVNYSLLGSTVIKQEQVFSYPYPSDEFISDELKNKKSTVADFPYLIMDEQQKTMRFKPGAHKITSDLIIPSGYKVIADEYVSLDLLKGAKIISYSALLFSGTEEQSLTIQSSDYTGQGIELINAPASVFNYVFFKNIPEVKDKQWERKGYITCYESGIELNACRFYNSEALNAVHIIRSDFSMKECLFKDMKVTAVNIDLSKGTMSNCVVENCRKGIQTTMSKMDLRSIYVKDASVSALCFKEGSQVTGRNIQLKKSVTGLFAEGVVDVNLSTVILTGIDNGIIANAKSGGVPLVNLSDLKSEQVKKVYTIEGKATVTVDGKTIDN
jgi:hypothetical protein